FTSQFMPDAGLDEIRALNELMPRSCSAATAAAIFRAVMRIDVHQEARRVRCPTLVLHGAGDLRVPHEEGRIMAALIPGARFITLQTRNHLMLQRERAWQDFLDLVAAFYPPRDVAKGHFPALTAREGGILELIAQGLDNAQIAARLELSEKTI